MCSTLGRTVSSCFRPLSRYARMKKDEEIDGLGGENDSLLWSRDLERHYRGEFSFAVVQANEIIEDHSQVETGRNATFVGVYDGHGGPEASRYICDHMFRHLLREVSRSIGDAYLKRPEFALDSSFPRFHLPEPLRQPVMRSDPDIFTRDLQPDDKFVIFASDGLWEHMTNQDAVEIVHNNPRSDIAKRLVVTALERAAMKRQIPYSEVKKLEQGVRRHIHDDITVVVIFIDEKMMDNVNSGPELSVRGFVDTVGPSNFNF